MRVRRRREGGTDGGREGGTDGGREGGRPFIGPGNEAIIDFPLYMCTDNTSSIIVFYLYAHFGSQRTMEVWLSFNDNSST